MEGLYEQLERKSVRTVLRGACRKQEEKISGEEQMSVDECLTQLGQLRKRKGSLKWVGGKRRKPFFQGVNLIEKTHLFPDEFVRWVHESIGQRVHYKKSWGPLQAH
jgi:hypothetical protein